MTKINYQQYVGEKELSELLEITEEEAKQKLAGEWTLKEAALFIELANKRGANLTLDDLV